LEYKYRHYRHYFRQDDLIFFQVVVGETDLYIGVRRKNFSRALPANIQKFVVYQRTLLQKYITRDPEFLSTLKPHKLLSHPPEIASDMAKAAFCAGTGPMAAVAGAFAERVGKMLAKKSKEVIVENGGDIFIKTSRKRRVGIFAGQSPLSNKVAIEIQPFQSPLAICTSSGTVGHSYSEGNADAAVVLSPSGSLADAVATAAANLVKNVQDLQKAVEFAMNIPGITGSLIIKEDMLAAAGDIKLV